MRLGYTNVRRYPDGFMAWQTALLPGSKPEAASANATPQTVFPSCQLMMMNVKSDAAYLNILHDRPEIAMEDIGADYLLVMIYNENCLACLDEIVILNQVYRMIESNDHLNNRVKMIGIGMGSKKRNLARFKKENRIPFPLFADERKTIFECLAKPVLPTSYLVALPPVGKKNIVFIQTDHVQKPDELVKRIRLAVDSGQ
ncbi:MAG TPA: redoxin domain-containing protein [Desulfatirhabdiaceae bacterium]|nr:redoxin domain-containing protein [Desulfatirhabdiaceae bacterium]